MREQLNELRAAQPATDGRTAEQLAVSGAAEDAILLESSTPPPHSSSPPRAAGVGAGGASPQAASTSVRSSLMRRVLQSGRKYMDSTLSALTADLSADIASQQQQFQSSHQQFQSSQQQFQSSHQQLQASSLTGLQSNYSNNSNNGYGPQPQLQPQSATELQQSTERVAELEREIAALQQYNAQWAQSYASLEAQCRLLVCVRTELYCTQVRLLACFVTTLCYNICKTLMFFLE